MLLGLRLLVSLLLIAFILAKVDFDRLRALFASISLPYFFLALFLVTVERVLLAYKWNVLLAKKKLNIPFIKLLKIYYASIFVGTFLPSSLGVEIFRSYSLAKYNSNPAESVSSVFVDKIIALCSSFIVVLVNVLLFSGLIANKYIIPITLIMTATFVVFSIIIINQAIMQAVINSFSLINLKNLQNKIQKFYNAFSEYMAYKGALFYVLMLSFLLQVVRVLDVYAVSLSLKQEVALAHFFIFVPIIIILTMLPLSLAGIGIREGAFVYFFSQVGMTVSEAFALSVLIYVLTMISILPGGIIFALGGISIKSAQTIMETKTES